MIRNTELIMHGAEYVPEMLSAEWLEARTRRQGKNKEEAESANEVVEEATPKVEPDNVAALCEYLSKCFVRNRNQLHDVDDLNVPLSQADLKKLALQKFKRAFPEIELTSELLRDVFQRAMIETHDDVSQQIPLWNGTTQCAPGNDDRVFPVRDMVAINTWRKPAYRNLTSAQPNMAMLEALLQRIFQHAVDRRVFIDWLAWCLKNEADKPNWAIFLYSRQKGTGKSTLCQLATRLFGEENSVAQNSIAKLTGKFNKPLLDSKLIVSEELQLKPDSPHGNTLKTYITERVTVSEAKGKEVEKVQQSCCFLFTSNHLPLWIEADERRYYVINVDHSGHASGPDAEEFGSFIAEFNAWMERDENIAGLYRGLLEHQLSNDFNPRSLNLSLIETPVMQQIMGASREVLLVRLEEILAGLGVFAVPLEVIAKLFIEKLKTNQNRIRHMMPELGWRSETAKWGGVDHSRAIWVHRDYQVSGGRVRGPNGYDEPIWPDDGEVEIIE
ncbi:hypothetical protein RA19_10325 [Leisingera sp. ANG-M1]|uniref:primase-helicase family protein n=1 Tax=Leisingera sp. ANG-M1 TaxID=1577895 RepID=UPI00057C68A8|nr:primase-helicase family protein [Leisingera sp. ANG-M1]KIC10778.1 hypothetical protein RA19_10325 [Leisingera sp. ANG-M1]